MTVLLLIVITVIAIYIWLNMRYEGALFENKYESPELIKLIY